jgi:hypothetical protein
MKHTILTSKVDVSVTRVVVSLSGFQLPKLKRCINDMWKVFQYKNYRTLCQRALWDLSKGKISFVKLPHSVPKGPLGLVQGKNKNMFT